MKKHKLVLLILLAMVVAVFAAVSLQAATTTNCNGVLTGYVAGSVTVAPGNTCLIQDAQIGGSVTSAGDLTVTNSRVSGSAKSTSGTLDIEGGSVGGDVVTSGIATVTINGVTVSGDVRIKNTGSATITNNSIFGSLTCPGSLVVLKAGNHVAGSDTC